MKLEVKGWLAVFLVVFAIFDVGGTVLAIVAVKVAVSSRREDCQHAEVLRSQNRVKTAKSKAELPETLKRLPSFNTPHYRAEIAKQFALEERQNAPEDCGRYANRALPWH